MVGAGRVRAVRQTLHIPYTVYPKGLSVVSILLIFSLSELSHYLTVNTTTSVIVDKSADGDFLRIDFNKKPMDFVPMDFKVVWAAMEECQKLCLTKAIGVNNFSCKKLKDILEFATIPPTINQVEINPLWRQKQIREFCKANGIVVTAYAPLGARGTIWGSNRVMENELLNELANAKGKTVAQICLSWAYEQEERMKQNLDIFNCSLTEEEHNKINEIPQSRGCCGEDYISEVGPYKTIEELWDGEM
ncbi:hypothetical protein K2173_004528 [Erythroxylum novogranatense]|uniref:NADP-dependent oxidoreductase domain-containing protein n=1 Tax=Erythroxylum novogranatense TaxID=1862640 RepID=A0AAV8T5T0_9ROSI|nr:hypothetical protein K2173_004528 [Erythroxylum novogranatense]